MTCPASRTIPTGLFSSATITCAKPDKLDHSPHSGPHRSAWITNDKINELTQTKAVRVEWKDA